MIQLWGRNSLLRFIEMGTRIAIYLEAGQASDNIFIDESDARQITKFLIDFFGISLHDLFPYEEIAEMNDAVGE